MKRIAAIACALVGALALPTGALAAQPIIPPAQSQVIQGHASGTVIGVARGSFAIEAAAGQMSVVNALTNAANLVTAGDFPYVYGGGHAEAGIASIGIKGPGYNGRRIGFDCSGSVAAVLSGAGVWQPTSGVPNDAGIIAQLLSEHLIARGAGTGPVEVTLYDHPGVHIFMNIDGRFFGTSDGGGGGDARGGAGWLDDGAPDATSRSYKPYHFFPWVLKGSTTAGHIDSFQLGVLPSGASGLQVGVKLRVTYAQTRSGSMFATALDYPGAITATGTVQSVAPDGSSLTLQAPDGSSLTLATNGAPQLLQNVAAGDTVSVTYLLSGSTTIALSVTVTATPPPSTTPPPDPTAPPTNGGSSAPGGSDAPAGPTGSGT